MTPQELSGLVGQEIGVSDWRTVDQAMIDRFADATGDRQWIHVDVERARREMGGTIAHGLLTLSLLPEMAAEVLQLEGVKSGLNYGFDRIRFTCPVAAGSRIRLRVKLDGVEPIPAGLQVRYGCTAEIEGGERPALVADWLTRIYV